MKKVLLIIGGIIALVIIIGAVSGGSKPSQPVSPVSEATDSAQNKTATVIKASEIADDFDKNQVSAANKWKGQFVQFSAEISNITPNGISFYNVGSKQYSMTQISCSIKNKDQLLSLSNGEQVTVKGIVQGQTIGVIDLSDCEVVK